MHIYPSHAALDPIVEYLSIKFECWRIGLNNSFLEIRDRALSNIDLHLLYVLFVIWFHSNIEVWAWPKKEVLSNDSNYYESKSTLFKLLYSYVLTYARL